MYSVLALLGGLAMVGVLAAVWQAKRRVAATTLKNAWHWMMAGCLAWAVAYVVTTVWQPDERGLADRVWYAIAVVMLCPPVSVLGARRPIVRVWTWFVLVPLLLVLGLPLAQDWGSGQPGARMEFELPVTLGYVLVLLMGVGNYFGTRFTSASLLFAASLLLLVLPMSVAVPHIGMSPEQGRVWGSCTLAAAALAAIRQGKHYHSLPNSLDGLWLDFRDWFGIVWAKRVQDRMNQVAAEERWQFRLELHGLVPAEVNQSSLPSSEGKSPLEFVRVERAFRWILRRFVDPEWIEERIQAQPLRNE